jgi:hypothetical protein
MYLNKIININFGEKYISEKPNIDNVSNFSVENLSNINIDSEGVFEIDNLDVGIYNIVIHCNNNKDFISIIVKPTFTYEIIKNIKFNTLDKSVQPIINIGNQNKLGFFSLSLINDKITIDNKTGILYFNNLDIGNYQLPIIYTFNNVHNEFIYNFNVEPIFTIQDNIITIEPNNGTFTINNDLIYLDNNIIKVNKITNVNEYNFEIIYTYNNISVTNYFIYKKLPEITLLDSYDFFYNDDINIIVTDLYDTIDISPIFYLDNDKIKSSKLDVGAYNFTITIKKNNIQNSKLITVIIKPFFNIQNNNIIVIPNNNSKIKYKGKETNLQDLTKDLIVGKYNFELEYTYNNISSFYNYIFEEPLIFYYESNNQTILYNKKEYSDKPFINNKLIELSEFKIIDSPDNITIDQNGIICFDKIALGYHSIDIVYKQNTIESKITYNFNVIHTIYYDEIEYNICYNESYLINKPIVLISNGIFSISSKYNLTINQDGSILIDKLELGNYNIIIHYEVDNNPTFTNLIINIIPYISTSTKIFNFDYSENININSLLFEPKGGYFSLDNDNFKIDNTGIITNNNTLIGRYNIKIFYYVNAPESSNDSYQCVMANSISLMVNINPILQYSVSYKELFFGDEFNSDAPIYEPKDGIFKIKNNPIGINISKNGIINVGNVLVGEYYLNIIYQKGNYFMNTNYKLIIKSKIDYVNDIFCYNDIIISSPPMIYPEGGIFSCQGFDIHPKTGILTLHKYLPANYNFNINYTKNNVTTITNYNVIIIPKLNFNDYLSMNHSEEIKLLIETNPPCTELKNNFNLNFIDNQLILKNLNVHISHEILITCYYNDISNNKILYLNVKPCIEFHPIKLLYNQEYKYYPKIISEGGIFESNDIIIDSKTGFIDINTQNICERECQIKYILDDQQIDYTFIYSVYPEFNYCPNEISIIYQKSFTSLNPFISYQDNTSYFELNKKYLNVDIDKKTGIITFNENMGLGKHDIQINYYCKNIITSTIYIINIIPDFYYDEDIVILNFGKETKISPYINPKGGKFEGVNINNINGEIILDNLDIGEYNYEIKYIYYDITVKTNIIVNVIPNLLYEKNEYEFIVGEYNIINKPFCDPNGTFSISNLKYKIKENGEIIVDSSLEVDIYDIIINYTVNNVVNSFKIKIYIKPFIQNEINHVNIFKNKYIIPKPNIKPEHGSFYIYNYLLENGYVDITEFQVGYHEIELIYIVNNIKNFIIYKIKVEPYIKLEKYEFKYRNKIDFKFYTEPICSYKIGELNYKLGSYKTKVIFFYNNIKKSIIVPYKIIPNLEYNDEYILKYKSALIKPNKCNPDNCEFYLNNNLCENGIVDLNDYHVGIYVINIMYNIIKYSFIVTIKPDFYYEKNQYELNYQEDYYINPFVSYLGGEYTCHNTNLNINKSTGIINFNGLEPNNYTFNIEYKVNNVSNYFEVNVIINPIFYYVIDKVITNNSYFQSILPIVNPPCNNFKLININKDINIDENGIISGKDLKVGKYYLKIIANDKIYTNYTVIINPDFDYKFPKVLYYNYQYEITPITNLINGKYEMDNLNNIILNKHTGKITFNKLSIGEYNLKITLINNNLTTTKVYTINVIPLIFYNYSIIYYDQDKSIYPITSLEDDIHNFKIDSDILNIDNKGIITNFRLEVGSYCVKVIYNNIYMSDFQFEVKPNISVFKNNELLFSPSKNDSYIINYHNYLNIIEKSNIGIYKTLIDYNINNIETKKKIKVTIAPKQLYKKVYEFYYKEDHIINPLYEGFYNFNNKYKQIIINNGVITINNLNIGKYKLSYYYTNNNYEYYGNLIIIIKPKIRLGFDMFYYGKCNPDPYLNPKSGIIEYTHNLNKLEPNNYNIDVIYTVNNIKDVFQYEFIIKPIIYCDNNYFKIKHNSIFSYPITYHPEPIVSCSKIFTKNSYINSNNNTLYFCNNLDVGEYNEIIYYNFNNQITEFSINFIIEPDFYYTENNKIIEYFDDTESILPYISIYDGSFSLEKDIKGITILENGILKFNKVDIGNYSLNILYKYKDMIFNCNYNLTVKNTFKYNEIKTNYSTNFEIQSEIPIVYPLNGTFYYKNNNNIKVDKNTGQITVKNLYAGLYIINILYNTFSTNVTINILPNLYYNISQLTLSSNRLYTIEKPQVFPVGGIFSADNLPIDSFINNETGEILCKSSQEGDYNIIIYYNFNNAINNYIINLRIL